MTSPSPTALAPSPRVEAARAELRWRHAYARLRVATCWCWQGPPCGECRDAECDAVAAGNRLDALAEIPAS